MLQCDPLYKFPHRDIPVYHPSDDLVLEARDRMGGRALTDSIRTYSMEP